MKKWILLFLCAVLLCGCSSKGKPKDLPQEVYNAAAGIVPAVEQYLKDGGDPSAVSDKVKAALDKINGISDGLDLSSKIKTVTVANDLMKMVNQLTKLSTSWLTKSDDAASTKELKTALKALKKDIGM